MPASFKSLTTIMAWILWICALVIGFGSLIMGMIRGDLFSADEAPPMVYAAFFAVAGFYAIVAGATMLLRKKLE